MKSHDSIWPPLYKLWTGPGSKAIRFCGWVNSKKECMMEGGRKDLEGNIIRPLKIIGMDNMGGKAV